MKTITANAKVCHALDVLEWYLNIALGETVHDHEELTEAFNALKEELGGAK